MTINDIDGSNDCEPESFDTLSQSQRLAIELLALGHNQTETATQVGKARETISRWKRIPVFEAALNKRRQEVCDEIGDMVRAADSLAMEGILQRLQAGDPKAQDIWLRMRPRHLMDTHTIGPSDPDEIIEAEAQEHKNLLEAEQIRLVFGAEPNPDMPNDYAIRKHVIERRRRAAGFGPTPEPPRPDTSTLCFVADERTAAQHTVEPLPEVGVVDLTGLTGEDYTDLVEMLFAMGPETLPDALTGPPIGEDDRGKVYPLDLAITAKLADLDEKEIHLVALDWCRPAPGRPSMEHDYALETIDGLHTLACQADQSTHLYLWIEQDGPDPSDEEV